MHDASTEIDAVTPGEQLADAGIQATDKILKVGSNEVKTFDEFSEAMKKVTEIPGPGAGGDVTLTIQGKRPDEPLKKQSTSWFGF